MNRFLTNFLVAYIAINVAGLLFPNVFTPVNVLGIVTQVLIGMVAIMVKDAVVARV